MAKTGRRMQISASFCIRSRLFTWTGWPPTRFPGSATTGSPALSPVDDLHAIPLATSGLHAHLDAAPVTNGEHLLDPREDDDGRDRHEHRRLVGGHDDLGPGEGPGPEPPLRVGDLGFHRQRAALLLDRRRQPRHPPAIGGGVSLHPHPDLLAHPDPGGRALGHGQDQPERMDPHQRGHRGPRGQVFAHRGPPLSDHALDRSAEHRVGEGLAGQLQLGSSLGQDRLPRANLLQRVLIPCLGHLFGGHGGIQLGAGHELLLGQAGHALAVQPGLVQDGAGLAHERRLLGVHPIIGPPRRQPQANASLVERGLGLLQTKLEVGGIEPGHDLTPRARDCRGPRSIRSGGPSPSG